jgi:hypothetical protein
MSTLVTIILAALQAVEALLDETGFGSNSVNKVISLLIQIIPLVSEEASTVIPYIKNIIAALKNDPATTQDQLSQLDSLDQAADQAFEAAATEATAQDQAAAS